MTSIRVRNKMGVGCVYAIFILSHVSLLMIVSHSYCNGLAE